MTHMSSCHSCLKSVLVFLNPAETAKTDSDLCHEVSPDHLGVHPQKLPLRSG